MKNVAEIAIPKAVKSRIVAGETLAGVAALLEKEKEVFVVYDEAVEGFLGFAEIPQTSRGMTKVKGFVAIEATEEGKTMETVLMICRSMMEAGLTRQGLVVAFGGGITCDLAGFAASMYKRGVRFASIPTTLLAQVDAAIGGKTGVDCDTYKNMLGSFAFPEWVYLCPEVLTTLPEREYRCGLAEMVKTFLVTDGNVRMDPLAAARLKAEIVERDPFDESGERRKLNFGHTFAHAIESVALRHGDDIRHGEAVAMGMVLAARLGDQIPRTSRGMTTFAQGGTSRGMTTFAQGGTSRGMTELLIETLKQMGLPTECPYAVEELAEAMGMDKKAEGDGIRFVLLLRPGETVERVLTIPECMALLKDTGK